MNLVLVFWTKWWRGPGDRESVTEVNYIDGLRQSGPEVDCVGGRKGHVEHYKKWLNDGVPGKEILRNKASTSTNYTNTLPLSFCLCNGRYAGISEISKNSTLCIHRPLPFIKDLYIYCLALIVTTIKQEVERRCDVPLSQMKKRKFQYKPCKLAQPYIA